MDSLKLSNYLEDLRKREPKEKTAKNRLAEIVEPYYKELCWRDESFFQDMTALWIALRRYTKWRTEAQLISLLEWTKGKQVYPLSLVRILNKK